MLDATRRTRKEIPPQESTWRMKRIVRFFPKLSGHPLTQKQVCRRMPSGRNREQLDATEEQWSSFYTDSTSHRAQRGLSVGVLCC